MPPPIKEPDKAWKVATPIEKFWLNEAESRLNVELSEAQTRALAMLQAFGGRVEPSKDERWKEASDYGWTLADTGSDLRTRLIGDVIREIRTGSIVLLGFIATSGVRSPNDTAVELSPSVLAVDYDNPKELVFAVVGEPWRSGTLVHGSQTFSDIRVIERDAVDDLAGSKYAASQTPKRRGPRSQKPLIDAIVRDLLDSDPEWLKLSFSERSSQVISEAKKRNPTISGKQPKGFGRTVIQEVCDKISLEITTT